MRDIQTREETINYTRIAIGSNHYYFSPRTSLESIADATASYEKLKKLADVIYNYKTDKFVKCKWKNINKMNGE